MALRYCFEESKVLRTLYKSRKNDLAVIDTDGISKAEIKAACAVAYGCTGILIQFKYRKCSIFALVFSVNFI